MVAYFVVALIAFSCGFLAAALLASGRRLDSARASNVLAEAVDSFTVGCRDARVEPDERIAVDRIEIEGLRRALDIHDQLRSA